MNEDVRKVCEPLVQEKEQSQDEYEKEVHEAVQGIARLVAGSQREQIEGKVEEILDKVQRLAFMDGYQYAIAVLKEGILNMKS